MSIADEYAMFIIANRFPFCWYCGRWGSQRPEGWHGPFLIERAHIVNKPRREDPRAVVALCSLCHRIEHGETFVLDAVLPRCSLAHMLWLKRRFDAGRYDRSFLSANCIGRLPTAKRPGVVVTREFLGRQGSYPGDV